MKNWSLTKIILTVAALAVVAGASFLFASTQEKPEILQSDPEVIRNIDPTEKPFKGGGPNQPGGISVVPTEIIARDASVGAEIPDIVVSNNSQTRQALGFSFVPVTRGIFTGGAVIPDTPADIRKGKSILRLDKSRLVLNPGESGTVSGTIVGGDAEKMISGALTISFLGSGNIIPLPEEKNVKPQVENQIGISSMIYLMFDRPDSKQIAVEGVSALPERVGDGPVKLRFAAAVKSENDFLTTPKGVVRVTDSSGSVVASLPFLGDENILPRQLRQISTASSVALKPGNYELEARVVSEDFGQSLSRPLQIAADGTPVDVRAAATIISDTVEVKPGGDFPAEVQVANLGNKSFSPSGTLVVYPARSNDPVSEEPLQFGTIGPGDAGSAKVTLQAPDAPGAYTLLARISNGKTFLTESAGGMSVVTTEIPTTSISVKIRDWLSDNPLRSVALGVVIFGLLTAAGIGIAALLSRRKRSR